MNHIIVQPTTVPPGICLPGDPNALIQFVAQYLSVTFNQQINFFNYGSQAPSVSDQDKPWFRLDPQGRPMGWYAFYNGVWRKVLTASVGTITNYFGPTAGLFDSTGRGIAGSLWDGWALCNGQNGTPDLRNKIILGANAYNSSGGKWEAEFDGVATSSGGAHQIKLTIPQLPAHTHEVKGFYRYWRGSADFGDASWEADSAKSVKTEPTGEGEFINIMNPYVVAAKVMCIGY